MSLPSPETPLYNHPLPEIENWLSDLGCQQDRENLHHWTIERPTWQADLYLEAEELAVHYLEAAAGGGNIKRTFKYSLSRQDIEYAVFFGP